MLLARLVPDPLRPQARAAYNALALKRPRRKLALVRHYDGLRRAPLASLRYLALDRELDNFTYEIGNEAELAGFLAAALGRPEAEARAVVAELRDDGDLRARLEARLRARRDRNRHVHYGRRLGWYAVVRLARPALVVETGIHDGLGSAVLLRALERNAAEGAPGRLVSFDVREDVGWLLDERLAAGQERVIGDTRELLAATLAGRSVDVFVHDSDHRYEHETFELETILPLAAPGAALMTDNAHATTAFADFCERHGLPCSVFRERPRGHFYPGASLGIALVPGAAPPPV